jgi:hypothetical protein
MIRTVSIRHIFTCRQPQVWCKLQVLVIFNKLNIQTSHSSIVGLQDSCSLLKEFYILGYDAVYSAERQPTFRRIIPPASSGSKSKPCKKTTWSRQQTELTPCLYGSLRTSSSFKTAPILPVISHVAPSLNFHPSQIILYTVHPSSVRCITLILQFCSFLLNVRYSETCSSSASRQIA